MKRLKARTQLGGTRRVQYVVSIGEKNEVVRRQISNVLSCASELLEVAVVIFAKAEESERHLGSHRYEQAVTQHRCGLGGICEHTKLAVFSTATRDTLLTKRRCRLCLRLQA